ncbi:MAG: PKD domain-containing protein, partial [Anaerolineae bacterium]
GQVTRKQNISVVPHPAAQFVVDDPMPGVGQSVAFTSLSGGQDPLVYTWDFGDGVTANVANPTHQFTAPGSYQVQLTVENDYGRSQAFWPILVGLPPEAQMTLPDSVPLGQPVAGFAQGDASVLAYRWDMGDGRTEEGDEISHIYRQMGDFYVSMTAVNEFGSAELGQWLHIDPGTLATYLPLILNGATGGETAVLSENPLEVLPDPVDLNKPFVMTPLSIPEGTSEAEALLIYINEARRQFDLPPLAYVYELSVAAQQHTDDMAQFHYTDHTGSDGSYPLERLIRFRYAHGYAGEATAWGFENAYEAVEFWVNSPPHRRIILNPYATDVGVAFTVDYDAPNVWYWTAEFGNQFAAAVAPFIRLQEPEAGLETLNTTPVQFSWNYPMPLAEGQRFLVYWRSEGQMKAEGTVSRPVLGSQYVLEVADLNGLLKSGEFMWQVVLVDEPGNELVKSEERPLLVLHDESIPTPTPTPTAVIPITPSPVPTLAPTATAVPPTETPVPPTAAPPPIVTATPNP